MLWRVRTTLPDRPGALAVLAAAVRRRRRSTSSACRSSPAWTRSPTSWCSARPEGWGLPELAELVESAGGASGAARRRAREAALVDQPTRYVQAARTILAAAGRRFPEVVGHGSSTPRPTRRRRHARARCRT